MTCDNSSRIEPKRAHPWFTEPELFHNKKQAIDATNSKSISGISNINISPWDNTSSFQSVTGYLDELARAINFGASPVMNEIPITRLPTHYRRKHVMKEKTEYCSHC
uniref:Uncharacterized protein n=1 Tax=Nelumbo nucifera TaxID=4432 RepID=A0A822YPU0_NELNU|nr:TPA_asm: hypothetical protein HUJ06_011896 [Nelumbo nucifera]